jgi:cytochrome c oxidase subunit 2
MKRSIRFAAAPCVAAGLVAWTAAPASAADEGKVARGKELYQLCDQCHGPEGEGMRLALAPSIAGLPEWYVLRQLKGFREGHRGRHFDDISGMRMRPMARVLDSDADVEAAAAYVASLPIQHPAPELEGGDAARGQTLYTVCIACHGLDGAGNEALGSPPINHQSDWYMLTQLQHFKAGVRGTAPGDVQGALMRPMSMTLADEQAMKDVIAFIVTLSKTQAAK